MNYKYILYVAMKIKKVTQNELYLRYNLFRLYLASIYLFV